MALLILLRHGQSTANKDGVLAGWTPGVSLTDAGRESAAALAPSFASLPLAGLVSSPLQRCVETAGAALPGQTPLLEDELGECRYGAWTGRPLKDLAREPLWRTVQEQPSAAVFPDGADFPGESLAAMSARAVGAVRRLDAAFTQTHGPRAMWVAVSHGDVIKAILADAAGTHLDHFQRIHVDPGAVSVIQYTAQRPFVLAVNAGPEALARAGRVAAATADGEAVVGGGTGETTSASTDDVA